MTKKKLKLTRPELKRQRDALMRFERYLPMLKLKQQQLQLTLREVQLKRREALDEVLRAQERFQPYQSVLADVSGVNVRDLAKPDEVKVSTKNVAGVNVPVFESVSFPTASYSLFATPAWVDRTLADLRDVNGSLAKADVLQKQYDLLDRELTKIIQRVNLFEKIKIPEAREAIRVIRIKLGDEMTAAVGRAKIAKGKLTAEKATIYTRDNGAEVVSEANV
ncbi:MAG: V-type ATP synthase subunit D [Planctomycetes bacterium]|nr:V-type ATP synthase subunit D [Planctomycetota bacterium]